MARILSMLRTSGIFWRKGNCRKRSGTTATPQLENGVGMLRLLREETQEALRNLKDDGAQEELSIATACWPAPA